VFEGHQVFTRDKKGLPVTVVTEESLNGAPLDRVVEVNTFDTFGRQIRSVESRDLDGDGDLDASDTIETFTQAYDHQDRTVLFTDRTTDGTGTLLFSSTTTSVYGKNTVTETQDSDDDGDGTLDRHVVTVVPL
jgi:hypothetical protein